ncbi:MAG: thiamine-phosphate kinase [Rickettsiella sp.]|nr:thiamine-phosphate kinase [Rickettsiella sp.]
MAMNEFDLIQLFFNQEKINRPDVMQGIGDDAALLQVPTGQQLVVTTDTLVANKHFPENTSPGDIGYKALAVNLSDLAAMGAKPAWILLALTLPTADKNWLEAFTKDFFSLIHRFNCQLVGGDLTKGPLSITVQALGFVPVGKALRRCGAQVGDQIIVTGTLGDAGLALNYLQKKIPFSFTKNEIKQFMTRFNRPEPHVSVGLALRDIATSAIDISDGFVADLGHILAASQMSAKIDVSKIPLSDSLKKLPTKEAYSLALNAGDDYELCFTVPKFREHKLQDVLKKLDCHYTPVGCITLGNKLILENYDKTQFILEKQGFKHF